MGGLRRQIGLSGGNVRRGVVRRWGPKVRPLSCYHFFCGDEVGKTIAMSETFPLACRHAKHSTDGCFFPSFLFLHGMRVLYV